MPSYAFVNSGFSKGGFHLARHAAARCGHRQRWLSMGSSGIRPKVCIVGGGFGGLYTALQLMSYRWTRLTRPDITLVSNTDRFCFLPMLYEMLSRDVDQWQIAPTLSDILELARSEAQIQSACPTTTFMQGTMQGLSVDENTVMVAKPGGSPVQVPYDHLVLALGNEPVLDLVPGSAQHAFRFQSLADCQALMAKIVWLENNSPRTKPLRIFVIGAGFCGVELACALSERLSDRATAIELIDRGPRILGNSAPFSRLTSQKALESLGVTTTLNTSIAEVRANSLVTKKDGGEEVEEDADLVVWTTGTRPNSVVDNLGLSQDPSGRLLVSDELAVKEVSNVFAIGDIARAVDAGGQTSAATAQHAFQQSECLARNIRSDILGKAREQYRYQHLGEMMVLGRQNASLTGLGLELDGAAAFLARRAVYLARMPTKTHAAKVGASWAVQPTADFVVSDGFVL